MAKIKASEVLEQLQAIALADVTDLVQVRDGAVEVTSTEQLPRPLRLAISSIEKSAGGIKVKFYDKLKALELLGKYLSLFEGGGGDMQDSSLLEAILRSTGEVTENEISEIREEAVAGHDLVEPERAV